LNVRFNASVFALARTHRGSERGIVEQDVVLVVEVETATVQIGRADQRKLAIQGQRLGVQQAALVLKNFDPRGEQVRVVAAACRADNPRVVAGGDNKRRVHAPKGCGAQGTLQGLVGHVIRRCHDDLVACRKHQRSKHFRHRRVAHRRAGAYHLRPDSAWSVPRQRPAQELVQVLADPGHPVTGKQELVLPRDRAFHAHHRIDPRRVLRLHKKLGISTVSEAADRMTKRKQMPVSFRYCNFTARHIQAPELRHGRHAINHGATSRHATPADIDLTQQKIDDHTNQGQHTTTTIHAILEAGSRCGRNSMRAMTIS
jgi:hypothetical protein